MGINEAATLSISRKCQYRHLVILKILNWIRLERKDHIEISQFNKFEVLLLDCNHMEGFQKSETN